jgi:hypothetical protein
VPLTDDRSFEVCGEALRHFGDRKGGQLSAKTTDLCIESIAPVTGCCERHASFLVQRLRASPDTKPGESIGLSKDLLRIGVALCKRRRRHSAHEQRDTYPLTEP